MNKGDDGRGKQIIQDARDESGRGIRSARGLSGKLYRKIKKSRRKRGRGEEKSE